MEEIKYKFTRTPYIVKFDETVDYSFAFEGELDITKPIKESNIKRYVIEKDNVNDYLYLTSLEIIKEEYGFLLNICNKSLILVNAGENIYYLASIPQISQKLLFSILKTFTIKEKCYVDVTKFKSKFSFAKSIVMYERQS